MFDCEVSVLSDTCIVCGHPKPKKNKSYCSKKCMGLGKQGYKVCSVCGKTFKDASCNMTVCCSLKCFSAHRSQLHTQGVYDESIKKMRQGFHKKVDKTKPEELWTSRGWVIKSPAGQIYEVRNLMHFIREHPELFDGTPGASF